MLPEGDETAMTRTIPEIGVGIVGFGFIGKVHAYSYQNQSLFYDPPPARPRLVGVCTSREESAAKAREVGGFEFGTTRFEDLLERDDIDVISVATPNALHRDEVVAALEAGKHVYCDKPISVTLDEARDMVAAADARPELMTGMAFHMRFIPAIMRAQALIAEGVLGRIYHFRASYLHAGYADPKRPMSWRLGPDGGCLADLGSHMIDLMRSLMGEYASIRGTLERWVDERPVAAGSTEMAPVEVDDYCCLQARMASGALGFIEASRFATGTQDDASFELYGSDGVTVQNNNIFGNEKWGAATHSGPELFGVNDGDDAKNMNNKFIGNNMGLNGTDPNGKYDFFSDYSGGGNCWSDNSGLPQASSLVTKNAPEGAIWETERSSMNISSV